MPLLLTEDDVVDAVCKYLEQNEYRIVQRCSTAQRGEDIVAVHYSSGVTLRVEAKGGTSNDPSSKRAGKPFDSAQCQNHVSSAFYTAAAMLDAHMSARERVGVAFPETRRHRECLNRIKTAVQRLGVAVFWVDSNSTVSVESTWTL